MKKTPAATEAMVVRGYGPSALMYGPRPIPADATPVANGRVFDMHDGPSFIGTFRVVATMPDPDAPPFAGATIRYCVPVKVTSC